MVKFIFLIVGIIFIFGFIFAWYRRKKWLHQSQLAKGTIVELIKVKSPDTENREAYVYFPIVEFIPLGSDEEIVRFQAKIARYQNTFKVGNTVNVRYNRSHAHQADIDDFSSNWGMSVFLISMGIISFFFSVLFYLMEIGYM